jgi:hypothetical protein
MASGHVNRIKRPNTWLHRPMLQNVKKALANSEPCIQRSARCALFGRYEGKSGRRGHRVFVDTEVIRGGPLLEVAGHGREAWRAAAGPRGCCGRHFFPAQSASGVTASETYMRQSEPPCSRKSAAPRGIFGSLASSNGAQPIDRAEV